VTALARQIGIDAYFVHVRDVQSHFEREGWFFVSSHVAVGFGTGPSAMVVDFSREFERGSARDDDWRLAHYRAIDDATAVALYYNNVAVARMLRGDTRGAQRILEFFAERTPIEELTNNLGVVLNRRHEYAAALRILQRGIARSPQFAPLYTNALLAANGAQRPDVAADLEKRGQAVAQRDPFFLFARGLSFYQSGSYVLAARHLESAAHERPDSPVILGWLTRAYLSAGDRKQGRETFDRMRRVATSARLIRDLEEQYPELRTAF
jgi:tetratricopeptide (TPR) repeat protein